MATRPIVIILAVILGLATSLPAADLQQEFNGIQWSASSKKITRLQESAAKGAVRYFQRTGDRFTIADLTFDHLIYGFYQDQFFAVFINLQSDAEFNQIKDHLTRTFGKPRANFRMNETVFIWDYRKIKIKLKQDEKGRSYKLAYYYRPLSEKLNEESLEEKTETIRKLES
jgi:hypothetical protein